MPSIWPVNMGLRWTFARMRARVSGVVVAMWQEIWRRGGVQCAVLLASGAKAPSSVELLTARLKPRPFEGSVPDSVTCWRLRKLKGVGSASPGCSSNLDQSMVRPSRRGGVPVLRRVSRRPSFFRDSPRRTEAGSPERPAVYCCSPQWMRPLRKVPVVTMTAWAAIFLPSRRRTPVMRGRERVGESAGEAVRELAVKLSSLTC